MDPKMIETKFKDTSYIAGALAHDYNSCGYMTMIESITNGSKVKLTRNKGFCTIYDFKTCVDVDITTTDGGLLVNCYPSVFKKNFVVPVLGMPIYFTIFLTQVYTWMKNSNLMDDICDEITGICNRAAA